MTETNGRGVWARLSTHWYLDPRLLGVSAEAELLYVRAMAWCKEMLSDGAVPRGAMRYLDAKLSDADSAAGELVASGAWQVADDGWRFPASSWVKWQGTRSDVEALRTAAAERKRAYRARGRGQDRDA